MSPSAAPAAEPVPAAPPAAPPRMGLTLSGGGFRATLFHLGVVRFLYEEGLLPKVTHVCSVSGGSILAAHLVLNWDRYTSPDRSKFDAAAAELVRFVQCDLRGRVVRPWLVSWLAAGVPRLVANRACWRTSLLQRGYERLYQKARLRDLTGPGRPELHLLATSFTTGHLVAFGNNQMRLLDDPVGGRLPTHHTVPANDVPVALAVASSSAFPPVFPPVRVDHSVFGPDRNVFPLPHSLTDGGVFDNLGIRRLLWLFDPKERLDEVVVSDAQRSLTLEYQNEYNLAIGRTSRCVDLMMNRVSWFENLSARDVIGRWKGRLLGCRLTDLVEGRPYAPSPAEQMAVTTARTDLDDFTDDEVDAIVHHGYAVARRAAEADPAGPPVSEWTPGRKVWSPARPDRPAGGGYALGAIGRRKSGLFRLGHWATWALWGLLAFWALLPVALVAVQSYRARQAQAEAARQEELKTAAEEAAWLAEADADRRVREADEKARKAEEERQVREQHAVKKVKLLRTLGEVALAEDRAEWQKRWDEWRAYEAELRKDLWFDTFLNRPAAAAAADAVHDWKVLADTPEKLHRLAGEVRTALEPSFFFARPTPSEHLQLMRASRKQFYNELGRAAASISGDARKTLESMRNSRGIFWRGYWGEVALVSGPAVRAAAEEFGAVLRGWETGARTEQDEAPPGVKDRLKAAAKKLTEACQEELGGK